MATMGLNRAQKWKEIFRQVEAGETLRVVRGKKKIAIIQPAEEAVLAHLAKMGAQQIADAFPPHEYAKWDKRHGSR